MKKLLIKTAVKIIAFTLISVIVGVLFDSPIISNELALGQMTNSDTAFIIMDLYYKVRPVAKLIYSCIGFFLGYTIGCDFYKFYKESKEKV